MERLTIALAGDVMTGRGIDQILGRPGEPRLHEPYVRDAREYVRLAERASGPVPRSVAPDYVWGDALPLLRDRAPGLFVVNLETAVAASGRPWPDKGIHYRMHPDNVGCLTVAGIDCCVLSNNHVLDWGRAALDETLRTLHAAGLCSAGAGRTAAAAWAPAVLAPDGAQRVLVFGCATRSSGVPAGWAALARRAGVALLPDLSDATAERFADDVARERRGNDRAVVSVHWGGNWGTEIPAAHAAFAHRLIDLGAADIVHGHSSHHPLPVEVYRGRLVLHGCGDLINDYEGIGGHGGLRADAGCLYLATIDAADGALQALEIVPLRLRRLRLERADAAARESVRRLLDDAGTGTRLVPGRDGGWWLQWGGSPPPPSPDPDTRGPPS